MKVIREQNVKSSPGLMINLHKKCRNIFPVFYDGFGVMVNTAHSSHFRTSHSVYLSSITPGNYRFGGTYEGTKEFSPTEKYPKLSGNIDGLGNLNASINHLFGSKFNVIFDAQMKNKNFSKSQVGTHYVGDSFSASLIIQDPDFVQQSGCVQMQFLASLSPSLSLGAQYAYMKRADVTLKSKELISRGFVDSQVSLCGRYNSDHGCWSTTVSSSDVLLCYYNQASEQLALGMEVSTNWRTNTSVGKLAYKVELKHKGIACRGMIDTDSNVGSVFEKKIFDTPFTISTSCNLNYRQSNFRLGLGLTIDK